MCERRSAFPLSETGDVLLDSLHKDTTGHLPPLRPSLRTATKGPLPNKKASGERFHPLRSTSRSSSHPK